MRHLDLLGARGVLPTIIVVLLEVSPALAQNQPAPVAPPAQAPAPASPPATPDAAAAPADPTAPTESPGTAPSQQSVSDASAPASPSSALPPPALPYGAPAPAAPAPATTPSYSSPAPVMDEAEPPDDGTLGRHQTNFSLGVFGRATFVNSAGYDYFSKDDVFSQVSVQVSGVPVTIGPLSFAALLGWEYGEASSNVRGADTSLVAHRIFLAAEARYHLIRRLYAFGRLAPGGLLHLKATLDDSVMGAKRSSSAWPFGADLSAGAAFEFAGRDNGALMNPRGWVVAEGGYSWTASTDLTLHPEDSSKAPIRTGDIALGELALSGPFVRLGAMLTF